MTNDKREENSQEENQKTGQKADQETASETNARIQSGGDRSHRASEKDRRHGARRQKEKDQEKSDTEEKAAARRAKTTTKEAIVAVQQIKNWVSPIIAALLSFIVAMLLFSFDSLRTQTMSSEANSLPIVRFNEYKEGQKAETDKIYKSIDSLKEAIKSQAEIDRAYFTDKLNDLQENIRRLEDRQDIRMGQ